MCDRPKELVPRALSGSCAALVPEQQVPAPPPALGPAWLKVLLKPAVLDFECDVHNIWLLGDIWMPRMPRPTSAVVLLVGDTDGF